MDTQRFPPTQHWEIETLRQIHCSQRRETGSTSETEDIKYAYSAPAASTRPVGPASSGHRTPSLQEERKETARVSELGPRLAGYLEMNPLFIVRRDDYGNATGGGSPEVVIIPLSPQSAASPPPQSRSRGMSCCRMNRAVFVVPIFVLANIIIFVITMYRNNCPASQTQYRRCILTGLKRFSFQPLSQNPLLGPSSQTLLDMGALESELVTSGGQGWRLITCIWLHAGVFHLLLNMLGLLSLGLQMEQEFGYLKLGLIYVLSGFGGSLLSALFLRLAISVGASGALFGLMGALLSELLINWSRHERNWFLLSQLLVLLIINLALGKMPHVDNYAHLGGCISGFLLGFVLLQQPQFKLTSGPVPAPAHGIPAHEFTATAPVIAAHHANHHEFDHHLQLEPHIQHQHQQHHHYQQQQQVLQQQQQVLQQQQQVLQQQQQPCMVSFPRHRFIIWVLALNVLVVLYVVALIMLFRGVDVRQKYPIQDHMLPFTHDEE